MILERAMTMLLMAAVPSLADAQAKSTCVSRAEMNALLIGTMPDLVEGMRNKCTASLPANAFLPTQGEALVARYRAAPPPDWKLARSGFTNMAGGSDKDEAKVMAAMPDAALKGLLGAAFGVAITEKVKPKDCPTVDRFISALSPLPPANVATIITELMVLGTSDSGSDPFKICAEG